jgi:hypothetical protein
MGIIRVTGTRSTHMCTDTRICTPLTVTVTVTVTD